MSASGWAHARPNVAQDGPAIGPVGMADLREAVRRGIADFLAAPTQLLALGILYPAIALAAARHAAGAGLLELVYPLIAGLSLLGPVAALGLYEIGRRREAGHAVSWRDAFRVLRSPAVPQVLGLRAVLFAILLAWLASALAIHAATLGDASPDTPLAFATAVLTTRAGLAMAILGHAVGLVFAGVVLGISVISFPLLLDRGVSVATTVRASMRLVRHSPLAMAAWGLFVALSLAAASLLFFVGLAVVVAVLGHATWLLHRRAT
ncbi:MAG TPA: DUF2189 domain-containing protein [Falsiroseomonas sp.]|jgi:uncharacterized membrane protein|nr:DUF2189 domain-containing protein [Falsiroseomonas sp.]